MPKLEFKTPQFKQAYMLELMTEAKASSVSTIGTPYIQIDSMFNGMVMQRTLLTTEAARALQEQLNEILGPQS